MVNRDQSLSPMGAGHHRRAVGVFTNCQAAEQALHDLSHAGFSMDRVSLIAKDVGRGDAVAGNKADEGAGLGAVSGGTLGGITGLLVGLGTLAIPGIGPIMLAGADATTLATTLGGGAIGAVAGSLIGGLIGLGIPETRARVYGDRVSQGDYLVMVVGTDREIRQAEAILSRHSIQEWDVYDLPTEQTQPSVKLYEERLKVDTNTVKTGEWSIQKQVNTEVAHASIPLEKERVVIERVEPEDFGRAGTPGEITLKLEPGQTIRVEIYEEVPEIHKEVFVREEVDIHKDVIQKVVTAEETVRREELNIESQGHPGIQNPPNRRSDDRV